MTSQVPGSMCTAGGGNSHITTSQGGTATAPRHMLRLRDGQGCSDPSGGSPGLPQVQVGATAPRPTLKGKRWSCSRPLRMSSQSFSSHSHPTKQN